jgi:uncharacterized protein involved in response to NO
MLFGYTGAVIAGYMIVAGANWTGRYPVAGAPVRLLSALWLTGRAAMLGAPEAAASAVVDAGFLVIFAAALWREQIAARNGRNLLPCAVMTLLAAANIAFHLRGAFPPLGRASERMALGLITLLIAVMGGRLVPSFTRNWLAQRGKGHEPAPHDTIDAAVTILTAGALTGWLLFPAASPVGVLLTSAGAGALIRLARWRGWRTWREPLVWVLHLGYLWLGLGLLLLGLSVLIPSAIPHTSAVHALTAGAIGVMTLAMMTRTTLSHTGRARRTGGATLAVYLLVNAAALLRVLSPLSAERVFPLLAVSALLWGAAFGLFALVFGPMLATRRPSATT